MLRAVREQEHMPGIVFGINDRTCNQGPELPTKLDDYSMNENHGTQNGRSHYEHAGSWFAL